MSTYGVSETVDVHFEDLDAQGVVHNAREHDVESA